MKHACLFSCRYAYIFVNIICQALKITYTESKLCPRRLQHSVQSALTDERHNLIRYAVTFHFHTFQNEMVSKISFPYQQSVEENCFYAFDMLQFQSVVPYSTPARNQFSTDNTCVVYRISNAIEQILLILRSNRNMNIKLI